MSRHIDRTGDRYGRLIALSRCGSDGRGGATWLCKCDCGNEVIRSMRLMRSGRTTSCGCVHSERNRERRLKHGHARQNAHTSEYACWRAMKIRCTNPKQRSYRDYGRRGITVCERWRNSFEDFLADVGLKPGPAYSIDRIDVNGHYEPGNVRWATRSEQEQNKRRPSPKGPSAESSEERA